MRKYIFSINPGRSGSHYLSQLFRLVEGCAAYHEPEPMLSRAEMVAFNNGNEAPLRALLPGKLAAIQAALDSQPGARVYLESSHFFIMGFGWLLPEYLDPEDMGAIILKRDPARVGESWLRIHRVPGTEKARHSVLPPQASRNLSQPPAGASDLDLCIWHAREVYLRAEAYKERFRRIQYLELDLEDLNEPGKVNTVAEALGLKPSRELAGLVGVPTNTKKKGNVVSRTLRRLERSLAKRMGWPSRR